MALETWPGWKSTSEARPHSMGCPDIGRNCGQKSRRWKRATATKPRKAPAERRSLSRLGRCRVFQRLENCLRQSSNDWKSPRNAVSSRRFWRRDSSISTPAMFQVPFPPGCVLFRAVMRSTTSAHRRPFTPPVESRHFKHGPRNRRAIRHECAPTVQTSRPFAFSAA